MKNEIAKAYRILGVTPEVSDKEMRSAWRKLVRSYHPDLARTDPEAASRRMGEINAAYDAVAHHRLQKDKQTEVKKHRRSRPQPQRTARPDQSKQRHRNSSADQTHRTEKAKQEPQQDQSPKRENLPKRRVFRSPQEQRLIDAACAIFEETRKSLNAAAQAPTFSACR
ncbi:J domain-containing protein [Shimia sagamensis]|uniref:DnaJ domain-containing protein n=1 Tax=Shimia sagamensis TaxID=1566352 RepID=A0ABY1P2I9_9RHOB|nr:DnaJ domain-containing protein [Shimia sagamensis]SMP24821.1 DnaJ domain-containing protein [Shimia sagamensis]